MTTLKRGLDRILAVFLIVLMGASVINVLWQVFTRFVMNNPSSFTEELARFLLIWVGVLGAGWAVGDRVHLALDLLPQHLEGRSYEWLNIGIQVCVIAFAVAVMIVGGLRLVYVQLSLNQISASLEVPIGYIYAVLPLSGAVMVFYATYHIVDHLRALRTGRRPADTSAKHDGVDSAGAGM